MTSHKHGSQAEPRTSTVAYKGLDPDFRCLDHQYEVGKSYKINGKVKICKNGFHACENPFDVWRHYPVVNNDGRLIRYALVEQSGAMQRDETDGKIVSEEMTIKAEIPFADFVANAMKSLIDAVGCKDNNAQICDGDFAQIDSSGDFARIGSSGYRARIGSSGYDARIGSSGDFAQIGSSGDAAQIGGGGRHVRIGSSGDDAQISSGGGDFARIGSSGDFARIGSSGDFAQIGSSGDFAQIGSSGDDARIGSIGDTARIGSSGNDAHISSSGSFVRIGSSGDFAQIGSSGDDARIGSGGGDARIGSSGHRARIAVEGANSVVASAGKDTTVTACEGTWISLAEYDAEGRCVGFVSGCIGRDGLKPGVPYTAKDGKLVEYVSK